MFFDMRSMCFICNMFYMTVTYLFGVGGPNGASQHCSFLRHCGYRRGECRAAGRGVGARETDWLAVFRHATTGLTFTTPHHPTLNKADQYPDAPLAWIRSGNPSMHSLSTLPTHCPVRPQPESPNKQCIGGAITRLWCSCSCCLQCERHTHCTLCLCNAYTWHLLAYTHMLAISAVKPYQSSDLFTSV